MDRYRLVESELGYGSYGFVCKYFDTISLQNVAVKTIEEKCIDVVGMSSNTLREITGLKRLKHINVVSLLNVVMENSHIYLVFELVDSNLKQYIQSYGADRMLSMDTVKVHNLFSRLKYCFSHFFHI